MLIIGILTMIAVPKFSKFIDQSKEDTTNSLANLLNSTVQREFVDLNGLVLNLNKVNSPTSVIMQEIKSNENLNADSIVQFYSAGYENTTVVNELINTNITPSLTTDYVGIILPDNNKDASLSNTPTLNLNKPIKIILKLNNNSKTFVYENGVNVTEQYITTTQP